MFEAARRPTGVSEAPKRTAKKSKPEKAKKGVPGK
jgi:hypothetical protein